MTDNVITITLGRNRTKAQVFSDCALVNGYSPTITVTADLSETCSYDEFITAGGTGELLLASRNIPGKNVSIRETPTLNKTVIINYQLDSVISNPITEQDFGASIWAKSCDDFDRQILLEATRIRDEQATPTVIS